MKKINELDIRITRAEIAQITWSMRNDSHSWTISGHLLTESGRKVSDFTFSTSAWNEDMKIELPPTIDAHMRAIIETVTLPVLDKLNGLTEALPEGQI